MRQKDRVVWSGRGRQHFRCRSHSGRDDCEVHSVEAPQVAPFLEQQSVINTQQSRNARDAAALRVHNLAERPACTGRIRDGNVAPKLSALDSARCREIQHAVDEHRSARIGTGASRKNLQRFGDRRSSLQVDAPEFSASRVATKCSVRDHIKLVVVGHRIVQHRRVQIRSSDRRGKRCFDAKERVEGDDRRAAAGHEGHGVAHHSRGDRRKRLIRDANRVA